MGFDTEPRYIEYAREHYAGRGQFVCEHFAQAHVAKFKPFDAIMLFGIIHHVNDVKAEDLLGLLAKCLAPTGRVVTLDPCFTPLSEHGALDRSGRPRRFVRNERLRRLVAEQFGEVDARLQHVGPVPSTELIMRLGSA